MTFLFISCINL